MKFELEMKPLNKGKNRYIVGRHVAGRGFMQWFGWYSWLIWSVIPITFIAVRLYYVAASGWDWAGLKTIDWFFSVWLVLTLPSSFKLFRNWVLSRGASIDAIPPLVAGYNTGKMTVEFSDAGLRLTTPLIDEKIDWRAINTVFEHRKHIYLASGHNPISVLPATDDIRAFLQGLGYNFEK